jgi:hypothetical protein
VRIDTVTPRFGGELALQAQFTQAASVRRFASCQRFRFSEGGVEDPAFPGGALCAEEEEIGGTVFRTVLRRDSIRFEPVGVWRAFAQARGEAVIDLELNLRVGLIGGMGIQSNPNHLTDPSQQQLKLLGAIGVGMRRINRATNTEVYSLDVVYGAVQNYQVVDVLGPLGSDGVRPVIADPRPARRTNQLQAFISIRPMPGFRIRGMFTFNAPREQIPTGEGPVLPIPDLARVAIMTDRSLAQIITALVGGGDERQPPTESRHPAPAL